MVVCWFVHWVSLSCLGDFFHIDLLCAAVRTIFFGWTADFPSLGKRSGLLTSARAFNAPSQQLTFFCNHFCKQLTYVFGSLMFWAAQLARNAQGLVMASATLLESGTVVTGSPTLGRDFDSADDSGRKVALPGKAVFVENEPHVPDANDQDDDLDLEALQEMEDAAFKDRELLRESSRERNSQPRSVIPGGVFSPPTVKKRETPSVTALLQSDFQLVEGVVKHSLAPHLLAKPAAAPVLFKSCAQQHTNRPVVPALSSQQKLSKVEKFKAPKTHWWWLQESYVRDADERRPGEPEYDGTTVFIPKDFQMTDFQKQYWAIKKVNFDMLILAKLGKFYEMYENDAEVGHKCLGLNYTHGGREPNSKKMLCAGVPENSMESTVGKLVAQGYKVGIVEEMEKASDVKKAQVASSSARKVVFRSLRRIFTPGTMSDEEMLGGHESKPLVCLVPQLHHGNLEAETLADTVFGVCLVDCSTGRFNVGTAALHQLDVLLRTHRPHEVVHPRGRLNGMLKSWLRNSTSVAVWSSLPPGHKDDEFWPADVTRVRLAEIFQDPQDHMQNDGGGGGSTIGLPQVLTDLVYDESDESNLALNALGGAIAYLRKLGLDKDLLSLHNFQDLHGLGQDGPKCMLLDIQTLNGLDVLEPKGSESKGRSGGMTCLWHHLDRAVTPFGRRLLRWWVTRPLLLVHDIRKSPSSVL